MKYRKTFHIEGLWNIEDVEGPLYGTFTCLSGWRSPKPKLFSSQKAPCQIRGFFQNEDTCSQEKKAGECPQNIKAKKWTCAFRLRSKCLPASPPVLSIITPDRPSKCAGLAQEIGFSAQIRAACRGW